MATTPAARRHLISADEHGTDQFLLQPENDELIVRTGRQLIEACRLGVSFDVWLEEFRTFIECVQKWCQARQDKVRSCWCSLRGPRVMLFIAPHSAGYDFELADELTDLDLMTNRDFNVGTIEARQVPFDEICRFISMESARRIYGEHPGTPQAAPAQ